MFSHQKSFAHIKEPDICFNALTVSSEVKMKSLFPLVDLKIQLE